MEAECIAPNKFAGKSIDEISALDVWEGNRARKLGELFDVGGENYSEPQKVRIEIFGNVQKVKKIGARMTAGEIVIHGDIGMYLGEEMSGGKITVYGNADAWAGTMMKKGTMEIRGNASDYVGAAYRGSAKGMGGGTIIVQGNAGNDVGSYMKKGLIRVNGNVGQFAGIHMSGGTVFIQGNSEGRAGAGMTGGKVIVCGHVPSVLPTFTIDSVKPGVKVDGESVAGPFYTFLGDLAEDGKGKLYVSKGQNPHLKFYEEFL